MGQGACQAIEDAAVLSALVGNAKTPDSLAAAFKAFDTVRRGRPEWVVKQSREASRILTGQVSLNPADIAAMNPTQWWKSVWAIDVNAHVSDAIAELHRLEAEAV